MCLYSTHPKHFYFSIAVVCTSLEEEEIVPGKEPSGFKVTGNDVQPDGTVDTDDDTTTVTVTNETPDESDANLMEVTGKITPKDPSKSPTDDDVKVEVTVYPEDGSSPVDVPEDAVSPIFCA